MSVLDAEIRSKEYIENIRNYLIKQHRNIKFTSVSFLDTEIIRENNNFVTSANRKPIFNGILINTESFLHTYTNVG